ncbi:hypothetical protein CAEBREN_00073 [Caenorhabditis brenneri]|uniref:Uncharacterized protein n=1 Tax=Caenorhabditis brenneri TaxID=135651 RepID=G0NKE7_CAEBE|nr:hypothetical protein CAEBREN_00073 [Caenorhabditis brenneri]
MSCIYVRVIPIGMLHRSIRENIRFCSINLSEQTIACLQSTINARLGTRKFVSVIDGLRELGSDVSMWSQWKFLVYVGQSSVYMSVVEPTDDGVSRAQLSIQHRINLE